MSYPGRQNLVVAIVGGGYCGTMTAVHLLSQSEVAVEIVLINSGYPLSKGVAYSSYSHKHLLNVRAQHMSAFPDKPNHFIDWISKHENYRVIDKVALPQMFLPRNIYGHYLKDIFETAIRRKPDNVSISFVHDEAIDMEIIGDEAHIYFSVSPSISADKVVLATGNQLPGNPPIETPLFYTSKHYFRNPWLHEAVNNLDSDKDVLIIGNGLTMADVVIGLKEKNHKGKIYSISPNGFDLVAHRLPEPYTKFVEELEPPYDLKKLISLFDKHIHKHGAKGEEIIESLRPLVQQIWMSWTMDEKRWFVEHVRHIWEVARHRLPMQIHQQIQELIIDDKLEIIAGRLVKAEENAKGIRAVIRRKRDQKLYQLLVGRIINCTGPIADVNKMDRTLFENLVSRKLISADEMKLGINAKPDGSVLNTDGTESKHLFSIGSSLKGILWESTAVPELRMQAKNVAEKIIRESVDMKIA